MRIPPPAAAGIVSCLALFSPLFAQRGDKPGEVQTPLPSHIVIPPSPALSPEEALKSFKVARGFRIEIVAADPLVHDPIFMEIGPDGRLWVVEMRGYMPNVDGVGENQPVGSIAVLADTDGDGRMDKRTEFVTGLVMPRALALVRDGLLVGEPPHLWFYRDTNGDGVADTRTEVAGDYGDQVNVEHTANGLLVGLDNWVYSADWNARLRYRAGQWQREPTIARGQWGLVRDDTGRLYYNSNSVPLLADAYPPEYLARNPALPSTLTPTRRLVDPAVLTLFPSRVTTGVNRGYKTLDLDGKITTVTAACGAMVYRGSLFPAEFAGNGFIPEPAANLIKRVLISEDGDGVLNASNAYPSKEFLTSTDERFRPVTMINGPDGGLYVVDLYRGILQHRIYVTSYLRSQIESRNLQTPIGLGRIYRIVPDDAASAPRPPVRWPAQMTTVELIKTLEHTDGWWRDTAQRLLVDRADPAAIKPLQALAVRSVHPLTRLHALWTLEGLGALEPAQVRAAVLDADPRVAEAGVRLAEVNWAKGDETLMTEAIALLKSPRASLRRQVALSLGSSPSPRAVATLHALARSEDTAAYLPEAILSGLPGREWALLQDLLKEPTAPQEASVSRAVISLIVATLAGGKDAAAFQHMLALLAPDASTPSWARQALLAGLENYVPKSTGTVVRMGNVPAEPVMLAKLAKLPGQNPESARAAKLLAAMKWPGKPDPNAKVAKPLTAPEQALFDQGKTTFAICAGCHQPEGQGLTGVAPPLVNSRWAQGSPEALIRIVLQGKEDPPLLMPPLRSLDDQTIASVLTFVRRSWGHAASAVKPEAVAAIRKATEARQDPWKTAELEALGGK